MRVHTLYKKQKESPKIEFTDQDLEGVHFPHEDALVVNIRVANYDVRCVLINNGSDVNVIFLDTLKKMDFDMRRMEPSKTKLMDLVVK